MPPAGPRRVDCVFCQISSGRIPSYKLHETDLAMVFLDAFPSARGHCLVAPRSHHERLQDVPRRTGADMFGMAARAVSAIEKNLGCDTLVALHNGRGAGQLVPHAHLHLIPRTAGDGAGAVHSMFSEPAKLDPQDAELLSARLAWK